MHITFICPFDLDRLSGTPTRSRTTMRAATDCGEVAVITQRMSTPIDGVTLRALGMCGLLTFTRLALNELRQSSPEVVHGITTASVPAMLFYKLFKRSRVKIIFEMHGWSWFELKGSRRPLLRMAFYLLDVIGLTLADTVIVMSYTQKAFVSRFPVTQNKIKVVWGPVDSIPPLVASPEAPPLVVGYLGNSSWWQGLDYLIKAALMFSETSGIEFHLAGFEAHDEENFPRRKNIHYFGQLPEDEVIPFLQGCHVFVSPRVVAPVSNLQFPHKLSKYLSIGRPVIVSISNDQARIVQDAECGIVIDTLNQEHIANAIRTLAEQSLEERDLYGERAYRFAKEHFSPEYLAATLRKLYMLE